MNPVDANTPVCLRCQTVVSVVAAPRRVRNTLWWSKRGGVGLGASGYSTPGKYVCGFCGGGSMVPAGTPRGVKILAASGITVTGKLARARGGFGCATVIAVVFGSVLCFSFCDHESASEKADRQVSPTSQVPSPVALTPEQQAVAAKAQAAATHRQRAADLALAANQAAADKGDAYGLLRMGQRYRDGDGVDKDLGKARDYLYRAAQAGSPTAAEELARLPLP